MRLFLLLLLSCLTPILSAQVSDKDMKKLKKYEDLLNTGDIYKADHKADKLLEKYPNEYVVIDFKIRCLQQLYLKSLEPVKSTLVNVTSRVVRNIYYREHIDLLIKMLQVDPKNPQSCSYLDFLMENGNERPFDAGDTRTLAQMYASQLAEIDTYCRELTASDKD